MDKIIQNFPIDKCTDASNWEVLLRCTPHRKAHSADEEEKTVLSDFKLLDFSDKVFTDVGDKLNYNEGKKANPFDKISKYYGRQKNVFLFISMLKNEKYVKQINEIIDEKCDEIGRQSFLDRMNEYLQRIKLGESDAKEFLGSDNFPRVFFHGNYCGDKVNVHKNLNIDFTNSKQYLPMTNIFNKKIKRMEIMKGVLQNIKIYDNGKRVGTVIKDDNQKIIYSFNKYSSFQIILQQIFKQDKYEILIDINFNKIIDVVLKINGFEAELKKVLELPVNRELVYIGKKNLHNILMKYLEDEIKVKSNFVISHDECLPIKTLKDLKNWSPPTVKHFTNKLRKRKEASNYPKTLICHDMKGGYLKDRFINSVEYEDDYFFAHWAVVDIFVYFSHHLVTIPPCGWISAAHRNGVKVLGTFITEWDDGASVCEEFLANDELIYYICIQLVDIAVHYNFDGWLINIENPLKACQIPSLKKFVNVLTERMHAFCSGSQVIWYDSVIKNGDLRWQNALNDYNRIFFLGCDGMFLNYNWTEELLKESAITAGSRITDVYVGVDVFGRGCPGGGGFSTNIALTMARKFGLSVAIFAPGWVHECLDVGHFQENQFKFWGALQELTPSRIIEELPYYSSFCPGFGKKMFRDGKVVSEKAWFNLSLQQAQPIYTTPSSATEGTISLYGLDALTGGGCLKLNGEMSDKIEALNFKILETCFHMKSSCIVSYSYKPLLKNVEIVLILKGSCGEKTLDLCLTGDNYKKASFNKDSEQYFIFPTSYEEILKIGYKSKVDYPAKHDWVKRIYLLNPTDYDFDCIKGVSMKLIPFESKADHVSMLLGELEILPVTPCYNFTYEDLVYECDINDSQIMNIQCVLMWEFNPIIFSSDLYQICANEQKRYICTTPQFWFKLKLRVDFAQDIQILLCPHSLENGRLPTSLLKIPLKK